MKHTVLEFNACFKEFLPKRLFLSKFYFEYEFWCEKAEDDMDE